jgi:hypothetical protein
MKNSLRFGLGFSFALALTAIFDCSSTVDSVTNSIDCHTVCKRYADCFNADYDVDGCTDKCENRAGTDEDHQRQLSACDACIGDRSCTSTTFNCADDCVGIVP